MNCIHRILDYIRWMLPGMAASLALYLCLFPWRKRRFKAQGLSSGGVREAGVLLLFLFRGAWRC